MASKFGADTLKLRKLGEDNRGMKSCSFSIFKNMVTIPCKVVEKFKELLPQNPDQGQVEMFVLPVIGCKLRFLVFQFCGNDWIINVAEQ